MHFRISSVDLRAFKSELQLQRDAKFEFPHETIRYFELRFSTEKDLSNGNRRADGFSKECSGDIIIQLETSLRSPRKISLGQFL